MSLRNRHLAWVCRETAPSWRYSPRQRSTSVAVAILVTPGRATAASVSPQRSRPRSFYHRHLRYDCAASDRRLHLGPAPQWLHTEPLSVLASPERRQFSDRYASRVPECPWLIAPLGAPLSRRVCIRFPDGLCTTGEGPNDNELIAALTAHGMPRPAALSRHEWRNTATEWHEHRKVHLAADDPSRTAGPLAIHRRRKGLSP
jgi:hypothetical protein